MQKSILWRRPMQQVRDIASSDGRSAPVAVSFSQKLSLQETGHSHHYYHLAVPLLWTNPVICQKDARSSRGSWWKTVKHDSWLEDAWITYSKFFCTSFKHKLLKPTTTKTSKKLAHSSGHFSRKSNQVKIINNKYIWLFKFHLFSASDKHFETNSSQHILGYTYLKSTRSKHN